MRQKHFMKRCLFGGWNLIKLIIQHQNTNLCFTAIEWQWTYSDCQCSLVPLTWCMLRCQQVDLLLLLHRQWRSQHSENHGSFPCSWNAQPSWVATVFLYSYYSSCLFTGVHGKIFFYLGWITPLIFLLLLLTFKKFLSVYVCCSTCRLQSS